MSYSSNSSSNDSGKEVVPPQAFSQKEVTSYHSDPNPNAQHKEMDSSAPQAVYPNSVPQQVSPISSPEKRGGEMDASSPQALYPDSLPSQSGATYTKSDPSAPSISDASHHSGEQPPLRFRADLEDLQPHPELIDCPSCHRRTQTSIKGRSKGKKRFMNVFWWPLPEREHFWEETKWYCEGCEVQIAQQKFGKNMEVLV